MLVRSLRLLTTFLCSVVFLASAGAEDVPPGDCPPILPIAEIEAGQTGVGWTVVRGQTPEPFDVTILGIQSDGIAPGHHMAVIEIADRAGSQFVADAGGIWAGMSGSPVYVNGKLAGAVSYTFSRGPSMIGGMTLAEDMFELLSYGEPAGTTPVVELTTESRAAVAARLGTPLDAVGTSFSRLPIPIVVSGIAASALTGLQTTLADKGFHGFLVPGSSAPAPGAGEGVGRPVAGGNFAAVVSYGDVTVGGIGTTSYVCNDVALAFGHPLALAGATTFGANDATAFAIVNDPTDGPFKLASIGPSFGVTDQDRIAALRATLGTAPDVSHITARLHSIELDRTRFGATFITMPQYVRNFATAHLLDNVASVIDSSGGGSAVMRWKIHGKRSNGQPFELRRVDRLTSKDDIGLMSAFELLLDLVALEENKFEEVEFGDIEITGRLNAVPRQDRIVEVLVSKNGDEFEVAEDIRANPGDELAFIVELQKPNGSVRMVETSLAVPTDANGSGRIVVAGGADFAGIDCFSYPESCPKSLPDLTRVLGAAPRKDDVIVELTMFSDMTKHTRATKRNRAVVTGHVDIDVSVTRE